MRRWFDAGNGEQGQRLDERPHVFSTRGTLVEVMLELDAFAEVEGVASEGTGSEVTVDDRVRRFC